MAGTAGGMLFLPQIVRLLLESFSFSGAILVLAGLALHALLGSTLLQPVQQHMREEIIDVEMAPHSPPIETIKEDEDDDLPEMKTLLFPQPITKNGHQMRKNFSEVAISSMNNGMPAKRPTFPRIMSNGSNMAANGAVLSNGDLSSSIRRRKASVMSQLSILDFMGSNLLVHVNVSFEKKESSNGIFNTMHYLYLFYYLPTPHMCVNVLCIYVINKKNLDGR